MSGFSYGELFPTKLSLFIFIGYILLFVNQGLLVTGSQKSDNNYDYNTVTVVLFTEVIKLIASCALYCKDSSAKSLVVDVVKNKNVLMLYFIPAILYCLYNNLSFINLSKFDPTTYFLLLQLRVVITALLFQIIFKKKLSKTQWISLNLLMFGCMLKNINFGDNKEDNPGNKSDSVDLGLNTILILVQIICSCLAGVYNEYLLKKEGADVNIFVQNVFMYLDSIICNVILLTITGSIAEGFTYDSISKVLHYKVLLVMCNNAAIGIVTSFFLKTLNSILKTFASALELGLTAVLSYIFFNIPIYMNTVCSLAIVMYAIYLYSRNPVSNVPKVTVSVEKQELLAEEV